MDFPRTFLTKIENVLNHFQIIISKPCTFLDHETLNVIIIRVIELAVGLL